MALRGRFWAWGRAGSGAAHQGPGVAPDDDGQHYHGCQLAGACVRPLFPTVVAKGSWPGHLGGCGGEIQSMELRYLPEVSKHELSTWTSCATRFLNVQLTGNAQDRLWKKLLALPAFGMYLCTSPNWGHVTKGMAAGLCLGRLAYSSETV